MESLAQEITRAYATETFIPCIALFLGALLFNLLRVFAKGNPIPRFIGTFLLIATVIATALSAHQTITKSQQITSILLGKSPYKIYPQTSPTGRKLWSFQTRYEQVEIPEEILTKALQGNPKLKTQLEEKIYFQGKNK